MSKELEALNKIAYCYGYDKNITIIETALNRIPNLEKSLKYEMEYCSMLNKQGLELAKVLRIIKEKKVDIVFLMDCEWDLDTYNKHFMTYKNHCPYKLTQEEYELLKEVLL